jgi:8-amino-7-oxononanoate synthase
VPATSALEFLEAELDSLREAHLLRTPGASVELRRAARILLCTNDYLGLGTRALDDDPPAALVPTGAGASPVVVGLHDAHVAAQHAIADWLQTEASLLFSSGWSANTGTIPALVGRGDLIVSDVLNHASIIDGVRLSRAETIVVPHLDVTAIDRALASRARRKLVVVESCYSMDADGYDLRELIDLTEKHGAILYVDEAHGLGVWGAEGRGRCFEAGVQPDVLVGTMGKAIGLGGAFVAGSRVLTDWLWNRARSLVFSTATSPALSDLIPRRIEQVRAAEGLRSRLASMSYQLRRALRDTTGAAPPGEGPIVPWIVGSPDRALRASSMLLEHGIGVLPIRPPTVPMGSSRLRFAVRADIADADWSHVLESVEKVAWSLGPS